MERKNWAWRKKVEETKGNEELNVFDVASKQNAQHPISGCLEIAVEEKEKGELNEKSLQYVTQSNRRAELELGAMETKLQASEKDKSRFKYELHLLNKQLQLQEREFSKKATETSHRKHLDKIAQLEAECERLRGLVRRKGDDHDLDLQYYSHLDNDKEDEISWASALVAELVDKHQQSQDITVLAQIVQLIHPIALHLQLDTRNLVEAKDNANTLQPTALLHFLQHLFSLLNSILYPNNGFYSGQEELELELDMKMNECDKLRQQIEDLNKDLQSEQRQCQHLSSLNQELHKQLQEGNKDEEKVEVAQCQHTIQDLGKQLKALAAYQERCPWEEEDAHSPTTKPKSHTTLFRRLFCSSGK